MIPMLDHHVLLEMAQVIEFWTHFQCWPFFILRSPGTKGCVSWCLWEDDPSPDESQWLASHPHFSLPCFTRRKHMRRVRVLIVTHRWGVGSQF